MLTSSSSPAERNLYHHAFWAGRNLYIAKIMGNHEACRRAFDLMRSSDWTEKCCVEGDVFAEALDMVYFQSLQTEEKTKASVRREQAVKAAKAPRRNPFNDRILSVLNEDPSLSEKDVVRILCAEVGQSLITKVKDGRIYYVAADRSSKFVFILKMKDRVSRLRKKIL